ncbi:MAG: UvrD-helicase domain-containing protein [Bacilli bacterium]|nr:UvrD-helicase domain-containing protein [Bacilli bacterium]
MSNYQIKEYFNHEQREAILNDNTNILVSASAGTGKTTLMVERVIKKILNDRWNITDLMIVTFTEAAANELKERLEISLKNNLNKDEEFINKQLSMLDEAYISTFHALCLRLLKETGTTFEFDDVIKIIPNLLQQELKKEAFNILENNYLNDNTYKSIKEPFINLNNNNEQWFNLLNDILDKVLNNGGFEEFKANLITYQPNVFKIEPFGLMLKDKLLNIINETEPLLAIYNEDNWKEDNLDKYKKLEDFINNLKSALYEYDYNKVHILVSEFKLFRQPDSSKYPSIIYTHKQINLKIGSKSLLKKLVSLSNKDFLTIMKTICNNQEILLNYLKAYYDILINIKKERGLLEFVDLEQLLIIKLVNNQDICLKLKNKFKEIMIDEYQDTSMSQETIIKYISDNNVFMVGDLKQSIYAFRNATPQLFEDKYIDYQKDSNNNTLINLKNNYRSSQEVINFVNYIFKNLITKNMGGIDYENYQELIFGSNNTDLINSNNKYKTKIFFNKDNTASDVNEEKNNSDNQFYIKDSITLNINILGDNSSVTHKKIINNQVKYNAKDRYTNTSKAMINEIINLKNNGIKYQEITILVRSRSNIYLLENELRNNNIPYMLHSNGGFFENMIIKDLLALLRFITNPYDDVALLSILRSYFFNLNENDLLKLSMCDGKKYYTKLKNSFYQDILLCLENLLSMSKKLLPTKLIDYIYDNTDYLSYFINDVNYENILIYIANIKTMINDNLEYIYSLKEIITLLKDQVLKNSLDRSNPATLSQKSDVINIMTIHKSKGLEFNYVFYFDNSQRFTNTIVNYTYKNCLLLDYYDNDKLVKVNFPFKEIIKEQIKKDELSETLRILYVALTRAKKQLYIFFNLHKDYIEELNELLENNKDWLIDADTVFKCNSINKLLLLALLKHKNSEVIRNNLPIYSSIEAYTYCNDLFEVLPYNYDNLNKTSNNINSNKYPIKEITYQTTEVSKKDYIRPSKHAQKELDFENIKEFNTYQSGNIIHHIFELLDFNSTNIKNDIDYYITKNKLNNNIKDGFYAFVNHDLFNVIKNNTHYQEYQFSYFNKENNLINGIIDLLVVSDDEVLIIDYKSDHLTKDELKEYYYSQLDIYEDFIKEIYPHKKTKKLIYSLVNKDFIEL